ncbi:phosphatase 1 regulatory subunit 3B-like [Brachionus plicatilis]|uniref:Phosphatase 1 regulatory subunit 3B-like n=1 Tax=Brachionus plicatilis TaxID=10195 RepID=A0A3M7STS4_BRAPC|nr:phosphatase 1 regulatory subunit 3B-like [Brachionus plicatilis]
MMSSKSQPRPILKKSPNRPHPLFFSGNESIDDEEENIYHRKCFVDRETSSDQLSDISNQSSTEPAQSRAVSLRKSCLKSNTNRLIEQKRRSAARSRRPLSNFYIFHSREIDSQIMKFLLRSFNNFLQEFKSSMIKDFYDDSQLFTTFRENFLPKLKEFLLNGESLISDQLPSCNLGVTLSEPSFAEIENFRRTINQDGLVTSCSEQFFNFAKEDSLEKLDLDKSENVARKPAKLESPFFGSLPTSSFFESYSSDLDLKGNVLLKSIRPKPLRTIKDSLLLAHVNEAFRAKKSPENNIVKQTANIKKAVRFADTFGLELEKVKIISNNSFVEVFSEQAKYADRSDQSEALGVQSTPFLVLIPLFSVRKVDAIIRLEDYIYDYENKIIKSIVRVRNLSYEKRVYARITINNWASFYDLDAIYIRSDKNSKEKLSNQPIVYDYFGFCVLVPERANFLSNLIDPKPFEDCTLRVEFALCCTQNGISYWDNNAGENYKFQCFYNK